MPSDSFGCEFATHLVDEFRAGRMTRREVLRRGTVMGVSVSSLSALLSAAGAPAADAAARRSAVPGKRGGTMRVAVTPETIFQSGSLGKMFTSTAVMLLVEDGKISLTDPITKLCGDPFSSPANSAVPTMLAKIVAGTPTT